IFLTNLEVEPQRWDVASSQLLAQVDGIPQGIVSKQPIRVVCRIGHAVSIRCIGPNSDQVVFCLGEIINRIATHCLACSLRRFSRARTSEEGILGWSDAKRRFASSMIAASASEFLGGSLTITFPWPSAITTSSVADAS